MGETRIANRHQAILATLALLSACSQSPAEDRRRDIPANCTPVLDTVDREMLARLNDRGFFPKEWTSLGLQCARGCQPLFSPFVREWYTDMLAAADEPVLAVPVQGTQNAIRQFRFTWLRTFHKPVVVRVTFGTSGRETTARLEAKELSGKGGYEPGQIARRTTRTLNASEIASLQSAIASKDLFNFPDHDCDISGFDGAQWLFEMKDDSGYRFGDHWSPEKGSARRTGELMLRLTGWRFNPVY